MKIMSNFKKDNNPFETIELEAVVDTAFQAIHENDIKNCAYQQGYERGKKEGYCEARSDRYPPCCRCI